MLVGGGVAANRSIAANPKEKPPTFQHPSGQNLGCVLCLVDFACWEEPSIMVCVALFQLASCSPRSSPSSCCCCNFSLSSSSSTHSSISFPLHVSNFDRPCSSAPTSLWPRLSSISSTRAHRGVGGGGGGGGGRGRKELRVSRLEFTTRCLGGDQNDSGRASSYFGLGFRVSTDKREKKAFECVGIFMGGIIGALSS